jgi:hypothetical protein
MRMPGLWLLAGFGMWALGCTGYLDFDPRLVDGGGSTPLPGTSNPGEGSVPTGPSSNFGPGNNAPNTSGAGGMGGNEPTPTGPSNPPAGGGQDAGASSPPPVRVDGGVVARDGGGAGGAGGNTGGAGGSGAGGAGGNRADAGAPPVMTISCPAGFNVQDLFVRKCAGCHSASAPARGVDVVTPGLAARLVGIKSMCASRLHLNPTLTGGKPTGYFMDKLRGPVTGCGMQMPAALPPLTPTEMACVEQWAVQAINNAGR